MRFLNAFDYGTMILYFAIIIGIGIYLKKRASKNIEEYFVGGRSLPWWALGIAGMAHSMDLGGTMLIVSLLWILGPRGLFIEFRGGASLILAFMVILTAKYHRRSKCITGAQWMLFRFGDGFGGRFAQLAKVVGGVAFTVGMLSILIEGVGSFLMIYLPFPPFYCALIMIGIATIYSMLSGFHGVVFTDLFQASIILTTAVIIMIVAIMKVAGTENFAEIATKVTGQEYWTSALPQWKTYMPPAYEKYNKLMLFALFYLGKTITNGLSTGDDPKYFGARNDRDASKSAFTWLTLLSFRWPMMMGFAVLGIFMVHNLLPDTSVMADAAALIKQHFPDIADTKWQSLLSSIINNPAQYPVELITGLKDILGQQDWVAKMHLISFSGDVTPEKILPAVVLYSTKPGFRGLLLISLIAASMSTFDMQVNMGVALLINDIYKKYIRPTASNKELIYASWVGVAIVVATGFLLAYLFINIDAIWAWMMIPLFTGLTTPMLLRLYWWRFNGAGFAIGTFVGVAAAFAQMAIIKSFPDSQIAAMLQKEGWVFLYVFAIGLAGCIIGTYTYKPTDSAMLRKFYRATRPIGFWGPLKKTLPEDVRKRMETEHKNDFLAMPFVLTYQITLLMMPLQLIILQFKAFGITFGVFLIALAGTYFFWYKRLPEQGNWEPEMEIEDPGVPAEEEEDIPLGLDVLKAGTETRSKDS